MDLTSLARTLVPRSIRNWIRNPKRSLEYILLKLGNRWHRSHSVRIRENWIVNCHALSRKHFEVFYEDPSQSDELDSFIANCPEGIRLLDIGAHHGFFALAAAHYGGLSGRILCVEASPAAAMILGKNIRLNGVEHQINVKNNAIGSHDGMLPMLTTGPFAGDYFIVASETRRDTVMVTQISLATLLRDTAFAPTHVKMDIEGCEYEVIGSGLDAITRLKPILFLELHGNNISERKKEPEQVVRWLEAAGYRSFETGGKRLNIEEMRQRNFNLRIICRP